jgi:hypothetical protein
MEGTEMGKEGTLAWCYEEAARLRALARAADEPHNRHELNEAAARFDLMGFQLEVDDHAD